DCADAFRSAQGEKRNEVQTFENEAKGVAAGVAVALLEHAVVQVAQSVGGPRTILFEDGLNLAAVGQPADARRANSQRRAHVRRSPFILSKCVTRCMSR